MFVYIGYYVFLFIISLFYRKDEKFLFFYFLVFSIFYSFAVNIGPDWDNYNIYFEHMAGVNKIIEIKKILPEAEARFEWGFHILTYILTRYKNYYNLNIFVFNTISFFVYYKVFKRLFDKDCFILFTIYIMFYGNRLFLSTLRQNLSVCFFYLSLIHYNDKRKDFVLYFIISVLFHTTSLLFVPIILVMKYITHKRFIIISIFLFITGVIGFQLGFLLPKIILTIFTSFIPSALKRIISLLLYGSSRKRDLLSILQFILIVLIYMINKKKDNDNNLNIAYVLIIFSIIIKFHFMNVPMFAARLRYNFGLGYIYFTYNFVKNNSKYISIKLLPILYTFLLTSYSFFIVKEDYACYVPYENSIIRTFKYIDNDMYFDKTKLMSRKKIIMQNK